MDFKLVTNFKPTGDQPQAINQLTKELIAGTKNQVLLGVTGSGKTFTIANVIKNLQKPTLIISHNKTLAAQLYQEFRDFFPENAVSYFVSYYDYYQPEAYIPQTDTYIEKETDINEEIDKLRLKATTNILTRKDTIIVASVSCIYNLGSPVEYGRFVAELILDQKISHQELIRKLSDLQYERSDFGFHRSTFRVRGEFLDIFPSYEDSGIRVEIVKQQIKSLYHFDPLTGKKIDQIMEKIFIYPAKHYVTNPATYKNVFPQIEEDLNQRIKALKSQGKDLEAHRIKQKVHSDLEMIQELGYVNGIENYSRYFDGRKPGDPPFTLFDYFNIPYGKDWLLMIDESHMTIPQIKGMYRGDNSRKQTLIDFGFRLPSALDNRPLRFDEFERRLPQTIFVSATPDEWEISYSQNKVTEQLVRPTGVPDPLVSVRPTDGQIDDLIKEIIKRTAKKERVLVTTLTKRMAEELTDYLKQQDIKVQYLHSDIETLKRTDILEALREGLYDVIVGINLLREGLDLPEVTLVAILDADKEGFLRSKTSLIQTMGRSARNIHSKVIMYADKITKSMEFAISEVKRRRAYQLKFNKKYHITPSSIIKPIRTKLVNSEQTVETQNIASLNNLNLDSLTPQDKKQLEKQLEKRMRESAKIMDFESATKYRDYLNFLKKN